MADKAHEWTDEQIKKQEKELHKIYKQAEDELKEKLEDTINQLDEELPKMYEEFKAVYKVDKEQAEEKLNEYKKRYAEALQKKDFYEGQLDTIAKDISELNKRAISYLNDQTYKVFSRNYNQEIDKVNGMVKTLSFNLLNEDAVRVAYKKTLPLKKLNEAKDVAWNRKQIHSQILQSILQGEPITKTAERMERVLGMNEKSAMRISRTLMTSAQNEGRQQSYNDLVDGGIVMKKTWIATADEHTRTSHLELDGEEVEVDEEFSNGLMFPGDMNGDAEEYYNCRCTMASFVYGFRNEDGTITPIDFEHQKTEHDRKIEEEKKERGLLEEKKEEEPKNPDNLKTSVTDVIGYPSSPKSQEDAMKEVNPHRDDWMTDPNVKYEDYRFNCQRCAPAYELSRRGYDVEAKKFDGEYSGWMDVFKTEGYAEDVENWVSNSGKTLWTGNPSRLDAPADTLRLMGRGPKGATKTIEEAMTRWGEGSRAVMCVKWKSGGGHIVNVENVGGKVVIYDSQVNMSTEDIEEYLKSTIANHTELCRVDHLKVREEMNEKFKSVVKKRET